MGIRLACTNKHPNYGPVGPNNPRKDPRHVPASQVVTLNQPPNGAMGEGRVWPYGGSQQHGSQRNLVSIARRQSLQVGGLNQSLACGDRRWRVSLTLEHDVLCLASCNKRNSLSFWVQISANDSESHHLVLRHSYAAQLKLSTTNAWIE